MRSRLVLTEKGIEAVGFFSCPGLSKSDSISFVVDTGSGASFLGWDDATRLGIEVDSLHGIAKPVMGFGGSGTDARRLEQPCFLYFDFEGHKEEVEMPGILVYKPARTKSKHWKVEGSISLLGRDFLEISRWALFVDVAKKEFYFET